MTNRHCGVELPLMLRGASFIGDGRLQQTISTLQLRFPPFFWRLSILVWLAKRGADGD